MLYPEKPVLGIRQLHVHVGPANIDDCSDYAAAWVQAQRRKGRNGTVEWKRSRSAKRKIRIRPSRVGDVQVKRSSKWRIAGGGIAPDCISTSVHKHSPASANGPTRVIRGLPGEAKPRSKTSDAAV